MSTLLIDSSPDSAAAGHVRGEVKHLLPIEVDGAVGAQAKISNVDDLVSLLVLEGVDDPDVAPVIDAEPFDGEGIVEAVVASRR